jgi:hypothetical protein
MWLTTSIDLTGYENCELSWWQRGETESNFDEAEVDISTNGSTWTNIYSEYIDTGPWEQETVDISAYDEESTVYLRYKINGDSSVCYDGWYVDDIEINGDGVSIDNTSLGNIKSMFE